MTEATAPEAPAAAVAAEPAPVAVAPASAPASTPEVAAEADAPTAAKFAALVRKEREVTQAAKAHKESAAAERVALDARAKELTEKAEAVGSLEELLTLAKSKPTEFFKRTGLTFRELTEAVLSEGEPPTADDRVAKLEAQIAADKAERVAADAAAAEQRASAATAAEQRAIDTYKAGLAEYTKANSATYEFCAAEGDDAVDLAFSVIEESYKQTGKILSQTEAVERVEAYYEAEAIRKYVPVKKLAARFAPPPPPPPATLGGALTASRKPSPTLTNKQGASGVVAPAPAEPKRLLTPQEIAAKFRAQNKARNSGA